MHIAFLNPQGNFDSKDTGWTLHPDFGGQLVYVKELALELGKLGHSVDIITRQIIDPNWTEFCNKTDRYSNRDNVKILRIPCGPKTFLPKEQLWPHLDSWVKNVLSYYRKRKLPDIFTTHYGDGGFTGILIKNFTGIPFTFTGHSLGAQKMDKFIDSPEAFEKWVEQYQFEKRIAAERLSMHYCSRIFTSTHLERKTQYSHHLYQNYINIDENIFCLAPPGVNLKIFHSEKAGNNSHTNDKIQSAINRDISSNRRSLPMVVCSSRLDRKKNHYNLVQAWTENQNLRASANLMIIIRGTENPLREWKSTFSGEARIIFSELVQLIEQHNLHDCIAGIELINQNELANCYRYLANNMQGIFALTALFEPFGLAPLEAMACGLPTVVTKNGGPSESLVKNGMKLSMLIDPQNPKDIANAILSLLDKRYWNKMRVDGLAYVNEKYNWRQTANCYHNEFLSILENKQVSKRFLPDTINSQDLLKIENFKSEYFKN